VIDAAPLFDYGNQNASRQPNVQVEISDAYRALLRSEGKFDAIVSIPSNTWVAGVEMLFSQEFLEAARDRLEPGGVYVQWFHANGFRSFEDEPDPLALALRTFASVFPHVAVWYGSGVELLIVGLVDDRAALDLARIEQQARRPDVSQGLMRAEIRSIGSLLAHELLPLGVVNAAPLPETIHTLLHPRLGYLAARAAFSGGEGPPLPNAVLEVARIGERNSLQQRWAARFGGKLPEQERGKIVAQLCLHRPRECQSQLAAWTHDVPDSPVRALVTKALVEGSNGRVDLSSLPSLLPLTGVGAPDAKPVSVADAQRATELFVSYYTHATPFSREALAAIWRRCEADPKQREACRAGRAEAERKLGALDAPLAPAADS
jgi:SAM-dependent methyltransferase